MRMMSFNWGRGIFLVIILFLGACAAFMIYSRTQKWTMVEEDYYPKELRHEEVLEKMRNFNSLQEPMLFQFTQNSLLRSNAREFETLQAKLGMLGAISTYNKPMDYIKKEQEFIRSLTPQKHTELARHFISPDKLYYVIAGDAETQLKDLEKAGLGKPELVK